MRPENSRILRAWGLGLAIASLTGLLTGCGGAKNAVGSSAAASGSATITINWPSRAIPTGTDYILVRVFTDQELTGLRTRIDAPTSGGTTTATISGLPYAPVLFMAEANTNTPTATLSNPLASGSRTVTITNSAVAQVNITMTASGTTATAGGRGDPPGSAVVYVRDVPAAAAGVSLRVLLNGQVVPNVGEPATVSVSGLTSFSSVPIGVSPLAAGTYLFTASAIDSSGTALARGSKDVTIVSGQETTAAISLTAVTPSDGTTGGGTTTDLGSAVLNVTNVAAGDALLVVDPMPGDPSQHDPSPVLLQLRGAFVQNDLPISRIPVLVSGLSAGPWLFVVTTHTGLATSDPVSRVGTVTSQVAAGDHLSLDVNLGSSLSPVVQPQGDVAVLTTNITGQNTKSILVAAFDSAGMQAYQALDYMEGVTERLVRLSLPGGPYTVVSAAYGNLTAAQLRTALNVTPLPTTIPSGALAIGSTTASSKSGELTDASVGLRLQGTAGWGSVNLAMLQVPIVVDRTYDKDTGVLVSATVVSSVSVRVYSMVDNQELTALRQVIVPPSWLGNGDGTGGLINPGADHDQLAPLRVRIDGVPAGQMRFEVTAARGAGGDGATLGRGSTIVDVPALGDNLTVTPVTVTVLPHGVLDADTIIPGISNTASDQNPTPRSRVWSGQPLAARLQQEWRLRRR